MIERFDHGPLVLAGSVVGEGRAGAVAAIVVFGIDDDGVDLRAANPGFERWSLLDGLLVQRHLRSKSLALRARVGVEI